MASDSGTLEGGHEFLYDYQCSLCEEEGQHVQATKFCKECFVYMCNSCVLTKHNRFPLNKRHQMLEHGQFSIVKASSLRSFPTKRCPKHPGELINIYCGEHDVVCCLVCKTLEHSNCAKSQHLVDAAKGIHIKSKECQNIMQETEAFLSYVEKVIDDGKAEIIRISETKEEVKTKIAEIRKRVDMYFDVLEANSLDELQNLESKIVGDKEQNVKCLDTTRIEADDLLQQLQSFKGDNECELFVNVKHGIRLLSDAKRCLLKVSRSINKESIYYQMDPKIEEFLKSLNALGSFSDTPVTVTHISENTRKLLPDPVQLLQFDLEYGYDNVSTSALNGYLLTSEYDELKRYNMSCDYIDSVKIPGEVVSLCDAAEGQAAVLYEREMSVLSEYEDDDDYGSVQIRLERTEKCVQKIAFIAIGRKMIINKIFSTVEHARQIAYVNGKVYVCSRDDPNPDRKPNPNDEGCTVSYIAIYNDNGQLEHRVPQPPQVFPFHLDQISAADNACHFLGYNQTDNTVVVLDLEGNVVDAFGDITGYSKFCTDGKGNVFATGSNSVVRLSAELLEPELLVEEKDGIKSPQAICFDKKHSRMLVTSLSYNSDSKKHCYTVHALSFN